MKGFREQLKYVQNGGCSVADIIVANSCDALCDFDYTDEEFEEICGIALHAYLATGDADPDNIAAAINTWFYHGKTLEELAELSKWDLLNASEYGWNFDEPWCEGWSKPEDCEDCEMLECNCNPNKE
jgi:hypothetical protein